MSSSIIEWSGFADKASLSFDPPNNYLSVGGTVEALDDDWDTGLTLEFFAVLEESGRVSEELIYRTELVHSDETYISFNFRLELFNSKVVKLIVRVDDADYFRIRIHHDFRVNGRPILNDEGIISNSVSNTDSDLDVYSYNADTEKFEKQDRAVLSHEGIAVENHEEKEMALLNSNVKDKQKENKMSDKLSTIIDKNKEAAVAAAKLEASKAALEALQKVSSKYLPEDLSRWAETPVGMLILANLMSELAPRMTKNDTAIDLSKKALEAAYLNVIQDLNIPKILNEFAEEALVNSESF